MRDTVDTLHYYPMLLKPRFKDYLWGGDRIVKAFHKVDAPSPLAESWEVSDRKDEQSIIENGPYHGKTLHELFEILGSQALLGYEGAHAFPLLIKILDAKERLSVQVHPSEEQSSEPKTEMWYILAAQKGAYVYAGLKEGTQMSDLRQAATNSTLPELLEKVPVSASDVLYIPAGTVHAIGPGCLILEVQQSSNSTYRLYDWDRVGPDGKPRELHLTEGLACTQLDAPWTITKERPVKDKGAYSVEKLLQAKYFNLDKFTFKEDIRLQSTGRAQVFFVEKGEIEFRTDSHSLKLKKGQTMLMPAAGEGLLVHPLKESSAIRISIP